MKRMLLLLAVAALPLFAGTKPNFTGTWKLNEALTKQGPPVGNLVFKIDHKEPGFKYSATGETARGPFNESAEFSTDGKEYAVGTSGKRTAHWDGEGLMVEVKFPNATQTWKLSLSADGKRMTREVTIKLPNREMSGHEVYDKQ